ncbi:protein of unknown function [Burkholderia multivorans]
MCVVFLQRFNERRKYFSSRMKRSQAKTNIDKCNHADGFVFLVSRVVCAEIKFTYTVFFLRKMMCSRVSFN